MRVHTYIAAVGVSCFGAAVSAAMIGVTGPFIGQANEGFENTAGMSRAEPLSVFGGAAFASVGTTRAPNVTGGWGFSSADGRSRVRPYEGGRFAGGIGGAVEYAFDQEVVRFGGWFAGNTIAENGTASFYNAEGALLGQSAISAPSPGDGGIAEWVWNGWQFAEGVSRVVLASDYGSGAFLLQDNLQADFSARSVPAPGPAVIGALGLCVAWKRRRWLA